LGIKKRVLPRTALLLLLLAVALVIRLHNIGFGLPSLYDPDEPMFMLTALKLPLQQTLNPGWFGHPGSTTIYLIALVDVIVVAFALATGAYPDLHTLVAAAYANPALLFIPARLAMVGLALISIWLTYVLGRRINGTATGLIAASFLAFNSLHIAWSQVVRTDIHASVFVLAALIFAERAARDGSLKAWILAGLMTGFAAATKWPAASVFVALIGVAVFRIRTGDAWTEQARALAAAGAAVVAGVFIASPYILLDWQTVLRNVSGEIRHGHLGHTGGPFLDNLGWYIQHQVAGTMGWAGLAAVAAGIVIIAFRNRVARSTLIPATVAFVTLICLQDLIWSRWILPAMPALCIFAAVTVAWLAEQASARLPVSRGAALAGIAILALTPSVSGAIAQDAERANDTRSQAARWAVEHIPAGSAVVIEHLELKLRDQPWKILFPLGEAGCMDAIELLKSNVGYDKVQKMRSGSPIVDLGNVNPQRAPSCRANYAILTYYDLYTQEAKDFPRELATYQRVLAGGRTVALFVPRTGHSGGPIVRIVAMQQRR
jgi:4-amino-4-deoxy-L-arabinose transferase-like glycosyltransferase